MRNPESYNQPQNPEQEKLNCIIGPIHLSPHPTRDDLKIGEVGGHIVVVGDHYFDGQLGFFIPENAIIPDKLAEEMWVKGRLAGKQKNRVKSRDFFGVHSEGLFYGSQGASWKEEWKEGEDITGEVGITFYNPLKTN